MDITLIGIAWLVLVPPIAVFIAFRSVKGEPSSRGSSGYRERP